MNRTHVPARLLKLGLPIPKAITQVSDLDQALGELRTAQPVEDLRGDLLAGKLTDPAKLRAAVAKTAQALAAHSYATRIAGDIDQTLEHLGRVAVRESVDEIIMVMRPKFEQAVAVLMSAVDSLGQHPQIEVAQQSPMLSRLFDEWRVACEVCRSIRMVCLELDAEVPRHAWFVTADSDEARTSFNNGECWGLTRDGHPAVLNTRAEAHEVMDAARREANTAAANVEAERKRKQDEHKAQLRAAREPATVKL